MRVSKHDAALVLVLLIRGEKWDHLSKYTDARRLNTPTSRFLRSVLRSKKNRLTSMSNQKPASPNGPPAPDRSVRGYYHWLIGGRRKCGSGGLLGWESVWYGDWVTVGGIGPVGGEEEVR